MPVYLAPENEWTKDGRKYFFKLQYFNVATQKIESKKSKKFKLKKEAEFEESKFLTSHENKINIKFDTVASLYFDNIYKKRKESTGYSYEDDYKRHIKPYLGNLDISSINIQLINEWKQEMAEKGFSLKYLNGFYNIIKGILDYACINFELEKNYMALAGRFEKRQDDVIKDDEKLRYITYDQFLKFISIIENSMYKTLFTTLYFTGMRKGELQALNWNDIDFVNNVIIVNKTLSIKTKNELGYKITATKNYKNRKVAMNKTLREQLKIYKEEVMQYADFNNEWFVFGNTRFLPQTTIDRNKDIYFKMINDKLRLELNINKKESDPIQRITIHEFRHSHVSLLINKYLEQCELTHQDIDTAYFFIMAANRIGDTIETMYKVYLHLFPSIQKPIVNLLDNL